MSLIQQADRVRAIAATRLDLLGLPDLTPPASTVAALQTFDEIVSWYGAAREDFQTAVRALELPFRFLSALPPPGSREHCADFFLGQAGCSGMAYPRISCPVVTARPRAVIHPFSGSASKNWPLARFQELARALPMPVEWCAGPTESLIGAIRIESLRELACFLAGARLYVGNDSGITHLAAAVGTPTVAIFGPTDPGVWAPRGPHVRVVPGDLTQLTVEKVLGAAVELI